MQPIISLKNVYKNYGSKAVLKNIHLDIYPGQVIGYIGPNGAGKVQLLKFSVGLLVIFKGRQLLKDLM